MLLNLQGAVLGRGRAGLLGWGKGSRGRKGEGKGNKLCRSAHFKLRIQTFQKSQKYKKNQSMCLWC